MVCGKCGAENTPEARFCKDCGMLIDETQAASQTGVPLPPKDFSQNMAEAGKSFGDAGRLLESLLIAIFVVGMFIGYAILWFSLVSPANWDKPEPKN